MTSPVHGQVLIASETLSALGAPVFSAVSIHVLLQVMLGSKTSLTLSTRVQLLHVMNRFVLFQMSFRSKPFVTHCTRIRSWMLSDIITISFKLHIK